MGFCVMRLAFWRPPPTDEQRYSTDDYIAWLNAFTYQGTTYSPPGIQQTLAGEAESAPQGFVGMAEQAWGGNAVVFACMAVRQLVFSAIRFQWQDFNNGRPAGLTGNPALRPLEVPWPGGTTQDLLNRMIQDADLAGNFYAIRDTPLARIGGDTSTFEIVRLRPDWVVNVREPRNIRGGQVGWRRMGIAYFEGGYGSGNDPVAFQAGEFAHFAPHPDPLANWRGMSWLTPVVREIQADGQMTTHKRKYFENGATPNIIVKYPVGAREEDMRAVAKLFAETYEGVDNAYKTLHIGGGADLSVVGSDMAQVDFRSVQGAGETRIAAAAGTPPAVVGLSEGLSGSSLNAGNYMAARRRLADGTAHPLWQNASGSLAPLIATPSTLGAQWPIYQKGFMRLWYDARDVPFLREDEKDAAQIGQIRAASIRQYIDAGFEPGSARDAVDKGDLTLLKHTGLFSVQLQPPNTGMAPSVTDPMAGKPGAKVPAALNGNSGGN